MSVKYVVLHGKSLQTWTIHEYGEHHPRSKIFVIKSDAERVVETIRKTSPSTQAFVAEFDDGVAP